MRENRTYGSEGGKSGPTGPPYPYLLHRSAEELRNRNVQRRQLVV